MLTSLSSLVDNLSEKRYSDKCKDCKSELDYMSVKDNQLIFQCLERSSAECNSIERNKDYKRDFAMETLRNLFCY